MADGHVPVIDLGEMEVLPIILILINVTIIIVVLSSVWRENQENVWIVGSDDHDGEIRGCGRKRYDEKEKKKKMKIEEGDFAEKGGVLEVLKTWGRQLQQFRYLFCPQS